MPSKNKKKKKYDPDRIIDDEDFLLDTPKPKPQDLPKGLDVVINPVNKKSEEAAPVTRVDVLTTKYLGTGKLPAWMKDSAVRPSRKEVDKGCQE